MEKAPEGFEGGISKEDTDNHLAWRFTGSTARVMLTMLDPLQDLSTISDVFARTFSGNSVFLADLPCGSGATSMSILSVLCELRKQRLIPRMPLHVVILGGEISRFAQDYVKKGLDSLKNELETQAITIEYRMTDWDVCDEFSNSDLIRQLTLESQNCPAKLLMVANFSGFLEGNKKWKEAKKQIEELFRHSRGMNNFALWIEPQKNSVVSKGGFMSKLINSFKSLFSKRLRETESEEGNYKISTARAKHPLKDNKFRVNLAVAKFHLPL